MKNIIKAFSTTALLSITLLAGAQNKPNIIYILADDMGYGDVAAYNENCQFPTPNLDRMAEEGMRFTDLHTNSSVCTPTRYGIMTGRYCWRTRKKNGVTQGHSKHLMSLERETVASLLKKEGYNTAVVGKWHLGQDFTFVGEAESRVESTGENVDYTQAIKNGPLDFGFDYYFGISASLNMPPHAYIENRHVLGNLTFLADKKAIKAAGLVGAKEGWKADNFTQDEVLDTFTSKTTEWIKKSHQESPDNPFFVYMPLNAPHSPIVPSKNFQGKSGIGEYGDFCMEVDWTVGEILKTLDELNIVENTLIIFTADNGCSPTAKFKDLQALGHYPSYTFRGLKGSAWEAGHRVPFIVRWPEKVKKETVNDYNICTTDLMATVADILDIELADNTAEDSKSFLPALMGKKLNDVERGGIVHHSDAGIFAIRKGKWKLVLATNGGTRRKNPKDKPVINPADIELFDMEKDAGETTNVQHLHPEVVDELKTLLAKYIDDGRSTEGSKQKNEPSKSWKQIEVLDGYVKNY